MLVGFFKTSGFWDKQEVQDGVEKFIEWIKSYKLEIRLYPHASIHAKVYIMTFGEGARMWEGLLQVQVILQKLV